MSKFKKQTALCVTLITSLGILSACGGGGGSLAGPLTVSGQTSVSSTGTVNIDLSDESNGNVSSAGVGLAAYATGVDLTRGRVSANAGIQNGATVGAAETSGTGSYSARYQYTMIDDASRTSVFISGTQITSAERSITLNADFDAGTLSGTTSDLDVNGTISGTTLGGSAVVDYDFFAGPSGTIDTTLAGEVGSTGVIAVFTGNDGDTVLAGGVVGTRN
ncbi:MAG: hypothetical protein ABJL99_18910 [Aliishimia sp.]